MKTILITGGSGLVGNGIRSICHPYEPDFHFLFLSSSDCNLLDLEETDLLFNRIRPHYVIHLAACVGGLYKNMNQKIKMLEDNLLINMNVLKSAKKYGVEKLIACLSTCIFPDKTEYPIDESMLHNGPPHFSNDCYAYAKRILEIQCRAYNSEQGTHFVCVIPTNIYGEYDNYHLEDSHVIPGLIHQCYLAKEQGIPFVIKGTGKPLRQFMYAKDFALILMNILCDYTKKDSIIVSPTTEYSIRDIATIISNKFDYSNLVFDETFSDGQFCKTANNAKLMEFLGSFEFTPLEEGISKTIDFFVEHFSTVRK